jgi:formylglycine-generating enzyme required for sulfatase activity
MCHRDDVQLGNYTVLGELGRGGSAVVYRAMGPDGKLVAVKVLSNAARPHSFARFEREQKLLDRLGEAEGFVPLLDSGESPNGPYFVMPLLTGGTLRQRLTKRALEPEECLRLMRMLAVSIGLAHRRGIVHRDLKPENILFNAAGRPLIADLGIAKYFGTSTSLEDLGLTKQGVFLGTLGYTAPEQIASADTADARSDVFSLAVIGYECLAGVLPFQGKTAHEVAARTFGGCHTPIAQLRIDTPHHFARAIDQALKTDPRDRYEDGIAFAGALGERLPQNAHLKSTERDGPPELAIPRASPSRLPLRALWIVPLLVLPVATFAMGTRMAQPGPGVLPAAPVKPTPAPQPLQAVAPAPKGWFDETLPPNVRLGAERPVYVYDTKKGLELELVYVPSGDFFMGAINGGPIEKPLHAHPVPWGYYIARTETTWDQYRAFCGATTRIEPALPSWPITGSHPVVNVSWFDAVAFCEWAGLSLPSEAEWEKAARGEDVRQWPWGDQWIPGNANIVDNSCPIETDPKLKEPDDGSPYTAAVMSFLKGVSPYGAHDMAGNVAEWTADWFDPAIYIEYSDGRLDPPSHGDNRCVRGGSWQNPRYSCTVSQRSEYAPQVKLDFIGFRPCLRTKK